jgi:hypothetical protein
MSSDHPGDDQREVEHEASDLEATRTEVLRRVGDHLPLLEYFLRNGLTWGTADLILSGRQGAMDRLGQVAAIFSGFHDDESKRAFPKIVVMLPPLSDTAACCAEIKASFGDALALLASQELTDDQIDNVFRIVECIRLASLEADALLEIIDASQTQTAFLISDAALYRTEGVATNPPSQPIAEDFWTPQLHSTVERLIQANERAQCHAVLDAGEFCPTRPGNRDMLTSIVGCGIVGADYSGLSDAAMTEGLARWRELASSGRIAAALSEIASFEGLSGKDRTFFRALMFQIAGLALEARDTLIADPLLLEDADPQFALQVAILAEQVAATEFASSVLSKFMPSLQTHEQLAAALSTAVRLRDARLIAAAEHALAVAFPHSKSLRTYRVNTMLEESRFDDAVALLSQEEAPEIVQDREFYSLLGAFFRDGRDIEETALIAEVSTRFPSRVTEARQAYAVQLEARGRRRDALAVIMASADDGAGLGQPEASLAIRLIERGLLFHDSALDDDFLQAVLKRVVEGLAHRPTDEITRLHLERLLSPQVLGSRAMPIMASVVVAIASRGSRLGSDVAATRVRRISDGIVDLVRKGGEWMEEEGGVIMGRRTFPVERLNMSADEAMDSLSLALEDMTRRLDDAPSLQTVQLLLTLASTIAPLSSDPDQIFTAVSMAAGQLAVAGHVQRARDYAEQALTMAGDSPRRLRLAWRTYGDVYARLGNLREALLAIGCVLAIDDQVNWEQVWQECILMLRIFRDLGLSSLSGPILRTAREALRHLGLDERYSSRLDTFTLQIEMLRHSGAAEPDASRLFELLDRVERNVEEVLELNDELVPAAMVLANAIMIVERRGAGVPSTARTLLASVLERVAPRFRALIETAATLNPQIDQVVALVQQREVARYTEDAGYDNRSLTIVARRLLRSAVPEGAEVGVYAVELTADQAVGHHEAAPGKWQLIRAAASPLVAARGIAVGPLSVVMLGLGDTGLVRIVVSGGEADTPVNEPESVFSPRALDIWARAYPYQYGFTSDVNEFYTSTDTLGVSQLPERAVIVTSIELQSFPVNLFQVNGDLAGRTRRLAAAPSLTWLQATHQSYGNRNGRMAAWIPGSVTAGALSTLSIVHDRLRDTFDRHGVTVSSEWRPPDDVVGSDLMIVVAHGGVVEHNRFFRVVKGDADLAVSSAAVAGELANIGVVVLFVCSSGRIDKHPGASTTVGFVKQLLNQGCSAVVAPPWPLDANVPPHWLPAFLDAWDSGETVIDACFIANQVVRTKLADDPAKFLAMTVYGYALARKSPDAGAAVDHQGSA